MNNREAIRLLEERLDAVTWAVYRVRRIVWAKGRADRRTERLFEGDRREAAAEVVRLGGSADADVFRLRVRDRGVTFPTVEEMIVATPAVVAEKSRPSFEENWRHLTGPSLWEGANGQ